jgi:SAM-dependent methyltransferase
MNKFSVLDEKLKCPQCSGVVRSTETAPACEACKAAVDVREGVLVMLEQEPVDIAALDSVEAKSREAYESRYHDIKNARRYNASYKQGFSKLWTTRREFTLLKRLLGKQPHSELLMDLPCGGGRLSPALAPFADTILEADVAIGQVLYAKENALPDVKQVWMTASALDIPLQDQSVDGVVSCRLNHHLPASEERDQHVRELLRVSKRFVIMTYFDYYSVKNTIRRIRRPFNNKLPKMTMTHRRLRELAAEQNARVVTAPWLAILSSGHRYALIVKDKA